MLPNLLYEANMTLKPKPEKASMRKGNLGPVSLMNVDTKILKKILANTPCTKI